MIEISSVLLRIFDIILTILLYLNLLMLLY